jgi:serine/threonine protein kinase
MSNVASNLVGRKLGKWTVLEKIRKDGGTGGMFSSCYIVQADDGTQAFLKAMNLEYAIRATGGGGGDRMAKLKEMTAEYEQEKLLCTICADERLDRVVAAIDWGSYDEAGAVAFVPYIVFTICKEGDVRRHPKMRDPSLSWRLRVFHGVAVGVMQLHSIEIFHQDLKPSNVLIDTGHQSKIADLGRATTNAPGALHAESGCWWGDTGYLPIEQCYRHFESDSTARRCAADLYMLGGILGFLVSNVEFMSKVLMALPPDYHPAKWRGPYKAAYPAVQSATFQVVDELVQPLHPELKDGIREMLIWLCHPDPLKRGHPENLNQSAGHRYSLERIVSHADRIANLARYYS